MFKLAMSYERDSLISVFCQCSMRTAFTGNMTEEVFNVVIVNPAFTFFFNAKFVSIVSGTA